MLYYHNNQHPVPCPPHLNINQPRAASIYPFTIEDMNAIMPNFSATQGFPQLQPAIRPTFDMSASDHDVYSSLGAAFHMQLLNETTTSSWQDGYIADAVNYVLPSQSSGHQAIPLGCQESIASMPALSARTVSWTGPAPQHECSAHQVASSPALAPALIGTPAGMECFTNMEAGDVQAVSAAGQLADLGLYRCDGGSLSPHSDANAHAPETWESPPGLIADEGTPDSANQDASSDALTADSSPESRTKILPGPITTNKKRVPKIHRCRVCKKVFPRPSGLETHMNTHSGARRK
jgi:hypothetical protein